MNEWTDAEKAELESWKRIAGIGESNLLTKLPNAEIRMGGRTMADRVPPRDRPVTLMSKNND